MPHENMSDVVVMHAHRPMRLMVRIMLTAAGYAVVEVPTYYAILDHLRAAKRPTVMVAGNWAADYRAEEAFFQCIVADPTLLRRHRFVLLTTIPEWLPPELGSMLLDLSVAILRVPFDEAELLATVAAAAGRTPAQGLSSTG